MESRGIVIAPSFSVPGPIAIDRSFLYFCVLYWDVLDCPEDDLGDSLLKNQPELQLLQEEGLLKRTRGRFFKKERGHALLSFHGEHPREFWAVAQLYSLLKHHQSGQQWTLGNQLAIDINADISKFYFVENVGDLMKPKASGILRISTEPEHVLNSFDRGPIVDLTFQDALPVPDPGLPLEEVLEFKQRHQDEFVDFRVALDEMYLEIIDSADLVAARSIATRRIQQTLGNINRILEEDRIKRFIASMKTGLSISLSVSDVIKNVAPYAISGACLGSRFDLPELGAALGVAGAVASAVDVDLDLSAFRPKDLPGIRSDFRYLFFVRKELG